MIESYERKKKEKRTFLQLDINGISTKYQLQNPW